MNLRATPRATRLVHGLLPNGKGDLAVMSIEAYEELTSRFELYSQIKEGMDDIASGNTRPFSEAMADIRSKHRG